MCSLFGCIRIYFPLSFSMLFVYIAIKPCAYVFTWTAWQNEMEYIIKKSWRSLENQIQCQPFCEFCKQWMLFLFFIFDILTNSSNLLIESKDDRLYDCESSIMSVYHCQWHLTANTKIMSDLSHINRFALAHAYIESVIMRGWRQSVGLIDAIFLPCWFK